MIDCNLWPPLYIFESKIFFYQRKLAFYFSNSFLITAAFVDQVSKSIDLHFSDFDHTLAAS
jgi:hypothetical protein